MIRVSVMIFWISWILNLKGFNGFGEVKTALESRQGIVGSRFEGNFQFFIYTPRQIAETLYFSLRCVDGLQGEGLRYVLESILGRMC